MKRNENEKCRHLRDARVVRIRRIAGGLCAIALMTCLASAALRAVPAQAETQGCAITLTPSAPAVDNGIADVYGYYNAQSAVFVDLCVQANGQDNGIRSIEYWITDGTRSGESAAEYGILYEDPYVEEVIEESEEPETPETPEEPAEPAASEEPAAPEEPALPEEPDTPAEPATPEEPAMPEEPDEPETPEEPETPDEPDEPGDTEDADDPGDTEDANEPGDTEDADDPGNTEDAGEPDGTEDAADSSAAEEGGREDGSDDPDDTDQPGEEAEDTEGTGDAEPPDEEPDDPETPGEPEEPETPDEPEEPEAPAEPDEPEAPVEPDEPETPVEPDEPKEPTVPDEPKQPTESKEPVATAEPETPDEPTEQHKFLESWEGRVSVDTARYHSNEVLVCVRATDREGVSREMTVQLAIDTAAPAVTVSYDNNEAVNGQYFNEARTATVVITEPNFDVGCVSFGQSARTAAGEDEEPTVLWHHNGDVHTALVSFTADGTYTLDVRASDLAGNTGGPADYGNAAAATEFTIDRSEPEVEIAGVSDHHGYSGSVAPQVKLYDRNFADYEISLTRTRLDEIDVDVTDTFFPEQTLSEEGGDLLCETFARVRDNDGIYTLRARAADLAGNESEASVTFSVNRFGSVYVFSDYLISLIQNGGAYAQEIEQDLVITEYNASGLRPGSLLIDITRDSRPMTEVVCDTKPAAAGAAATGSSGWYEYRYTLDRQNFAADGVYKISLSSEDEAGNTPDSAGSTGTDLLFRVDGTEPEITGSAKTDESGILEEGENFAYTAYDTMGLTSLEVYVDGTLFGDAITEFGEDANHYTGTLSLPANAAEQEVRFVAADRAGNVADVRYGAPSGIRTIREFLSAPAAALKQLAERGVLLPVIIGVVIAAAVLFALLFARKKFSQK